MKRKRVIEKPPSSVENNLTAWGVRAEGEKYTLAAVQSTYLYLDAERERTREWEPQGISSNRLSFSFFLFYFSYFYFTCYELVLIYYLL